MRIYRATFEMFDTEAEAKDFCSKKNRDPYLAKNHPAHYTPWTSLNGKEHKFIAWYYTR